MVPRNKLPLFTKQEQANCWALTDLRQWKAVGFISWIDCAKCIGFKHSVKIGHEVTEYIKALELIYQLQTWDFPPSVKSREGSNWKTVSETSYPPPHINHCYLPGSSCSSPDYFVSPFAERCSERQAENGKEKVNSWLKVSYSVLDGNAVDSCGDNSPTEETWRKL